MAVSVLPLLVPSKGRKQQRHQSRARMHHPGGLARKDLAVSRAASSIAISSVMPGPLLDSVDDTPESQQLGEVPGCVDTVAANEATPLQAHIQSPGGMTAAQATILELFGTPPVAFHRPLVELTGSVTAALWLSNAIDLLRADPKRSDDSFELSKEECLRMTGLSRREQETARQKLRELGIVSERRTRARIVYTLHSGALTQQLYDIANRKWQDRQDRPSPVSHSGTGGDTRTHG